MKEQSVLFIKHGVIVAALAVTEYWFNGLSACGVFASQHEKRPCGRFSLMCSRETD
jgi:hypothetical protein